MASKKSKKESFVSRDQYDTLQSEYLACQRKLHSKDEAVKILRRELEFCQEEKEDCIQQMNQIKSFLIDEQKLSSPLPIDEDGSSKELDDSKRVVQLEAHIVQLKQKHKEDIQTLKEKLSHARKALSVTTSSSPSDLAEERSLLITQLEAAQSRITDLQRELQSLEDEKEDLLSEKDYFAGKCSSLNKQLEDIQGNKDSSSKTPSMDTLENILEENRKLKIDLIECESERDSALSKIERYKRAVERRKAKENQSEGIHMDKQSDARKSLKRVQELESLANSLSEEIKEKSLALTHQRKTNKLLGTRIAELEHRLKVLEISGLWTTSHSTPEGALLHPAPQLQANIVFDNHEEEIDDYIDQESSNNVHEEPINGIREESTNDIRQEVTNEALN